MPTTPLRSYPYPALAAAPDVPADISALAAALDTDVGAFHAAWASYVPTWTAATTGPPAVGSGGSLTGARTVIGKTCHARIRLLVGGAGFGSGTGAWSFGLPIQSAHSAGKPIGLWTYTDVSANDRYIGTVLTNSSTVIQCVIGLGPTVDVFDSNSPVSHGVGDELEMCFTYETV